MLITYCDTQKHFSELEIPPQGGIFGYDRSDFVVLDEIGVSAMHMRLSFAEDRLFIEDLQSLNGTYVNRKLISEKTELHHGDSVLIGLALLYFEKNSSSWSVTAIRQDSSLFIVDESEPVNDTEIKEEVSTAVTIIASSDVKEAIKSGDVGKLQNDSFQKIVHQNSASFSFDALQELGKYKIIKKIGKGGMGVVFLAKHKVMNTYRALKVLPHSVKEDNYDFFERFMREARIASEIRHPNIVGVMDAETDSVKEVSYIVMEFIDGGTLRRILKMQKALPEVQALLIVKSVAEALKSIAEHKIIHRDIKPDNIMFTRHGDVKLADLGIAKSEEDVNLTKNDIMIGTPAYLSPEQIETPKDVDIRSDIYSLGATLYEMLTGTTPYAGKNTYDIVQKMISESIVDPRKKNPFVSAITAKIVMKMLHKNPAKRYQTPQALLDALNEVLQRYPVDVTQNIIRSAVLGTELPHGVKKTVSSGVRASINFMFFSCRQSIVELFFTSADNKTKQDNENAISGKYFSFQIESDLPSDKTVDFIISASPSETYKISSIDGYYKEIKASDDGMLKIKNLSPGEYRIFLQNKKNQ